MADQLPPPKFINDPHAPETFATWATGFMQANSCVHITLEAIRSDFSNDGLSNNRVVVGRIVMPLAAAQGLADGLTNYLKTQVGPMSTAESNPVVH